MQTRSIISRAAGTRPPASPRTPDEDYQLSEMSDLLARALSAMAEEHRLVIILKHLLLQFRENSFRGYDLHPASQQVLQV